MTRVWLGHFSSEHHEVKLEDFILLDNTKNQFPSLSDTPNYFIQPAQYPTLSGKLFIRSDVPGTQHLWPFPVFPTQTWCEICSLHLAADGFLPAACWPTRRDDFSLSASSVTGSCSATLKDQAPPGGRRERRSAVSWLFQDSPLVGFWEGEL